MAPSISAATSVSMLLALHLPDVRCCLTIEGGMGRLVGPIHGLIAQEVDSSPRSDFAPVQCLKDADYRLMGRPGLRMCFQRGLVGLYQGSQALMDPSWLSSCNGALENTIDAAVWSKFGSNEFPPFCAKLLERSF